MDMKRNQIYLRKRPTKQHNNSSPSNSPVPAVAADRAVRAERATARRPECPAGEADPGQAGSATGKPGAAGTGSLSRHRPGTHRRAHTCESRNGVPLSNHFNSTLSLNFVTQSSLYFVDASRTRLPNAQLSQPSSPPNVHCSLVKTCTFLALVFGHF